MNFYADVLPDELLKCEIFWQTLTLCSARAAADELKLVFESSDASIKSMNGVTITYKQIHEILKKAFNSKPILYQPLSFP